MFRLTTGLHTYTATRESEGASHVSIINIGYDDEELKAYSIALGLEPLAGGELEFFFSIVEADGETDSEYQYWTGKDVARFMHAADRAVVLAVVAAETEVLIREVRPAKVHYVTIDENPPEKALLKHFVMAAVFESCGYRVITADSYHGKRVWVMELPQSMDS